VANQMSTKDQGVQERAAELAGSAKTETRGVVDDARSEASAVASEAGTQVRNLADEAITSLRHQVSDSTGRAAGAMSDLGSRFRALADGNVEQAGDLGRYAGDLGERLSSAADRLGDRGFDGLVEDVQRFARRRPGVFLAAAAASGFAAGRLFRGARAEASSGPSASEGARAVGEGPVARPALPSSGPPDTWVAGESVPQPAGPAGTTTPGPTPYGGATSASAPDYPTLPSETGDSR